MQKAFEDVEDKKNFPKESTQLNETNLSLLSSSLPSPQLHTRPCSPLPAFGNLDESLPSYSYDLDGNIFNKSLSQKNGDSYPFAFLLKSKPNNYDEKRLGIENVQSALSPSKLFSSNQVTGRKKWNIPYTTKPGWGLNQVSPKRAGRRKKRSLFQVLGLKTHDTKPVKDGPNPDHDSVVQQLSLISLSSSSASWNGRLEEDFRAPVDKVIQPIKAANVQPLLASRLDTLSVQSLEVEDLGALRYSHQERQRRLWESITFGARAPTDKTSSKVEALPSIKHVTDIENSLKENSLQCWMAELPNSIKKIPINNLLIPGSHDSFSYSLESGEVGPDAPSYVSHLATCSPCIVWPALIRWSMTQKTTAFEQLYHGVRYFDIRVAVRHGRFHFVHGLYGPDLEPLLSEIRWFLDGRPEEVVFLDFQHLHGLQPKDHLALAVLIKKVFSHLICPPYDSLGHLTLSYLAKHKYQVLVFYRNTEVKLESQFWPGSSIPNPWPQKTRVSDMMSFLKEEHEKKSDKRFFVTQCVLTPSGTYLATNVCGSLEKNMAEPCNKAVLQWVLSLPGSNRQPNVIMTDFVNFNDWAIPEAIVLHNTKTEDDDCCNEESSH